MGRSAWRPVAIGVVAGILVVVLPPRLAGVLSPQGGVPQALRLLAAAGAVLAAAAALDTVSGRQATRRSSLLATELTRTAVVGTAVVTLLVAGVASVANTVAISSADEPPTVLASSPLAVSRGEIDAARWIRDHSSIHDLVMTNRHCITPAAPRHCDSRRFVVAAFSERQVLLEGWTGTPRSTTLTPAGQQAILVDYWKPGLLALNDGFIAKPDALAAAKLVAMGVRWVLVDFSRPHAQTLAPFAHLRFHTEAADVYQLRTADGTSLRK